MEMKKRKATAKHGAPLSRHGWSGSVIRNTVQKILKQTSVNIPEDNEIRDNKQMGFYSKKIMPDGLSTSFFPFFFFDKRAKMVDERKVVTLMSCI